jgi:cleavage and polyadenylation specificity factor subunit 3
MLKIHQLIKGGGKVLLPTFALGRAQEIMLMLEDYWAKNPDLHKCPIYFNSPLALKCGRIYETFTDLCSKTVRDKSVGGSGAWQLK